VVNIDNGYGAGHMAALINQRIMEAQNAGAQKAETPKAVA
jgi:hypothetical protein